MTQLLIIIGLYLYEASMFIVFIVFASTSLLSIVLFYNPLLFLVDSVLHGLCLIVYTETSLGLIAFLMFFGGIVFYTHFFNMDSTFILNLFNMDSTLI